MSEYVTVSFSGGKDSTAMLLHMIELGEHIDEVITADTGMEFPAMYDHIARVRKIVKDAGIKYTTLRAEHPFEYYMLEYPVESKTYGSYPGFGWPSVKSRWCTKHLKTNLIDGYFREIRKNHTVIQCIGLACDEVKRLARAGNQKEGHRHPLVEWGWSEADALEYCYAHGYDWGGLYNLFNRVSCWCCPLSSISELRKLWKHYPDLWAKLERWEEQIGALPGRQIHYAFKDDTSVFDLARRFELEESRQAKGMSIDTPGFYQNLRRISTAPPQGQTRLAEFTEGSE